MNSCNTHPASTRIATPGRARIEDIFEGFFAPGQHGSYTPELDLTETNEGYEVHVDVPGLTLDQINVQFAENTLTLNGDRVVEKAQDTHRWHVVERGRGAFARSIRFPGTINAEGVKATMKNGVLIVNVPKTAKARTQKIQVTES